MSGKFISLEGGEGAGKSTQARRLADWLRETGIEIVETREPGGTPGADAIRALLLDPAIPLAPLAEAHLFAAARADHVAGLIEPALEAGKWVVSDRFIDSSLAYQGGAGGLGIEKVRAINASAVGDCWPDLTLLLRIGTDAGAERARVRDGGEDDRFSARDIAFHDAVAAAFDALAAAEPDRFAIVDAEQDADAVTSQIRALVEERLL